MMLLTIILLLLTGINANMPLANDWLYPKGETGIFLLLTPNKSDQNLKISSTYLSSYNILFIFILIILLGIFVTCLCYGRILINFIFKIWSKMKRNSDKINEHVTILHRTPTLNKFPSTYLTVPQTFSHYN